MVLNLEGDQIRDETTGKSFWDYPMLKERLLSKFGRSLRIEDAAGNLLNDVFAREYADGSAVILSYSQKPRTVFAARNGARIPVALQSRGVEILPGWKVEIDSPNLARAEFENGEFSFEVPEDMDSGKSSWRRFRKKPSPSSTERRFPRTSRAPSSPRACASSTGKNPSASKRAGIPSK